MDELKITTFNIRCFGFGGEYFGKHRVEHRKPFLKDFIRSNFSDTDVFVFQEIMNPLIIDQILPDGFTTHTYSHDYNRHMFIVFACQKELEIKNFQTIVGTALDTERSRPAVYGSLTLNDKPILDLIGVHLKSKHDHTDERIQQAKVISQFIEGLSSDAPKVMTGDFNSHFKEKTGKPQDDLVYLQEAFENQLTLVGHDKPTYLSASDEMSLDHFFVKGLKTLSVEVYQLPQYSPTQSFKKFYNEISDHLPVSLHFGL